MIYDYDREQIVEMIWGSLRELPLRSILDIDYDEELERFGGEIDIAMRDKAIEISHRIFGYINRISK